MICTIRPGSTLGGGRVKPTLVQDCGAVSVTGDTIWTVVERSGEAGATSIESEATSN